MVHVTRLMQGILYTVNSVKFIYTVYMVVGGMISRGFNMGLSCSIYVPAFYCSSLGVSQHWVSPKSGWLVLPMTKLRESQGLNV